MTLDPTNLKWRRELSYAHSNLGSVREAEGDLAGALEQFRATLEIDEQLAKAEPRSRKARSELAASHTIHPLAWGKKRLRFTQWKKVLDSRDNLNFVA